LDAPQGIEHARRGSGKKSVDLTGGEGQVGGGSAHKVTERLHNFAQNASPMKTRKNNPSNTRARLLAAATELFSAKGFDGVSVDEIVVRAGANKRMVYHYFGSKEAIHREVLREVYDRLGRLELALGEAPLEDLLEAIVRAYFSFLAANPEFVQLLLWENLSHGRHLAGTGDALSKAPMLKVLRQVLERGVREKHITPGLDPRHPLINLIGLCLVYFSNRYTLSRAVGLDLQSPRVLESGIGQIVRLLRQGVLRPTAR
jgi:TetR/AcrR family transcriptional regulator